MRLRLGVAAAVCCLVGCGGKTPAEPAAPPTPSVAAPVRSTAPTGSPAPSPTGPEMPGELALRCESPVDTLAAPPSSYTAALDAVALTATLRQVVASGPGEPHRFWAKTGLVIRADRPATLTVPRGVAIGWGTNGARWATTLRIPGCPGTAGRPWMAYPGGFVLDAPQCVPVEVRTGSRRTVVRVPIGRAC